MIGLRVILSTTTLVLGVVFLKQERKKNKLIMMMISSAKINKPNNARTTLSFIGLLSLFNRRFFEEVRAKIALSCNNKKQDDTSLLIN